MSEQRHEMDAGWPFFVAAAVETPIQAVLHAALAYVHRHGVCEFTHETDALCAQPLSVCSKSSRVARGARTIPRRFIIPTFSQP